MKLVKLVKKDFKKLIKFVKKDFKKLIKLVKKDSLKTVSFKNKLGNEWIVENKANTLNTFRRSKIF